MKKYFLLLSVLFIASVSSAQSIEERKAYTQLLSEYFTSSWNNAVTPSSEPCVPCVSVDSYKGPNSQFAVLKMDQINNELNDYQWFVVDGLFSDILKTEISYIPGILKEKYGVQDSNLMAPSTFNNMEEQAQYLYQLAQNSFKKNQKKLIFLAQSRGAHILFHTFLKYPQLIEITHKAVYIQGAFYGSPLADISINTIEKVSKGNTKVQKEIKSLLEAIGPAIDDLRPEKARLDLILNIQALYKNSASSVQSMKNNFWFIRSQKPTRLLRANVLASGVYLSRYYGNNDGVVLTRQQLVPGWGLDIGIIPISHLFVASHKLQASDDTLRVVENIISLIRFDLETSR